MRTEKTLAIIFLVGLLFKYMHWPGGSIILILSLMLMASLYFPGAFYFFCDKKIEKQKLPLSIASGVIFSIITVGLLFKLQYWPGANNQLLIGCMGSLVILAFVLYFRSNATEELTIYYKNMLLRTSVLTSIAFVFYFTSTETLLKVQYRDLPELAKLKALYYANPDNEEYRKQHDDYIMKLDSMNQVHPQ